MKNALDEAAADRLPAHQRGDCAQTVLVAIGDSVTSAHIQNGFGDDCASTTFDRRRLPGNDGSMSYAGLYAGGDKDVVGYYNVARTGFTTRDMVGATPAFPDACRTAWQRAFPPAALATAVVKEAERVGDTSFVVGTAGANDTNWSKVIAQAFSCRSALHAVTKTGIGRFEWMEDTDPTRLIPDGGGCVVSALVLGDWQRYPITVPPYDGARHYAELTANVRSISDAVLQAGADKVVWTKYHDISPAQVDMKVYLDTVLKTKLPAPIAAALASLASHHERLVAPAFATTVQGMIGQVNAAVAAGLPENPKVVHAEPVVGAEDMQNTMIGGAPHPNGTGHAKMARQLKAALGR